MTEPEIVQEQQEEFNPAEEIIADLSNQVAQQAREIAFLRTALKQRDQMLQQQHNTNAPVPNRAARRAKKAS